ncbi:MAG TPA: hypothetical protein VE954_42525 [Oligoflexus sp.]|uniref:hypothetical protein n=1 Tax=Oligoflexus sp. TaxID=1971216 RepID=UPI002D2BCE3E|nr:hypothetical protein [Oligoflexus sp.]HYX39809.1 hypothetical protein [Oligoflexus sp.]HYX39818.1 hypothetical protein [Oligoflexus sp.]
MKKLIAIALAFTASAAFAETWTCVCTQQDDFGACIAWQCTKGDYPGESPLMSAKLENTKLEDLLKKVEKTDTEVQISVSSK